jgi:transposase
MRNPKVDLWALDEVHFQQHGSRCRMWVPPEIKDPILRHAPTRKKVGYFGAVRLRDGKLIYRREPENFDAETFFVFMKQLRQASCKAGRKVVVIIDNARFHHAALHRKWRNDSASEFELFYLPAYSPDLNPIERVWKLTRRLCTHNRYFGYLDEVIEAIENQFAVWVKPNESLRRLCAII